MVRSRWYGLAAVAVVPGIVCLAAGGCVGTDPEPTVSSDGGGAPAPADGGIVTTDGDVPALDPDAAPSLGCPLGCLPPAPNGWVGPSAVFDADPKNEPAECPTPYTVKELDAHRGMTVGATTCDCGAESFGSVQCSVTIENHKIAGCTDTPSDNVKLTPGTGCVNRTSGYNDIEVKSPKITGTCGYAAPKASGPLPEFEAADVVCGLPQFATCSEKSACVATPVPAQPFTRLCIHKAGVQSCPSLDYTARVIAFESLADDRACTCSGTLGGTCTKMVLFYASAGCTSFTSGAVDTCEPAVASVDLSQVVPNSAKCTPKVTSTTGAIAETNPVTLCCNK